MSLQGISQLLGFELCSAQCYLEGFESISGLSEHLGEHK